MYILNNQEEAMLKKIIKNARIDYFRKNKHIFNELELDEDVLYSNDKVEENIENKLDSNVQAGRLEDIFDNENLSKIVKALTFNEKWVLSLYYIEEKTDEEIGAILFMTKSAVTKKRNRALEKNKKGMQEKGDFLCLTITIYQMMR